MSHADELHDFVVSSAVFRDVRRERLGEVAALVQVHEHRAGTLIALPASPRAADSGTAAEREAAYTAGIPQFGRSDHREPAIIESREEAAAEKRPPEIREPYECTQNRIPSPARENRPVLTSSES